MECTGEVHLEDHAKPGEIHKLKAGDVVHVVEGTSVSWGSPNNARGKFNTCLMKKENAYCYRQDFMLLSTRSGTVAF
jgi:hypothetical protein